jgi:hypothetical protein
MGTTNDLRRTHPPVVVPADAERILAQAHQSIRDLSVRLRDQNSALTDLRMSEERRPSRRALIVYGLVGVVPAATIVAVAVSR